MLTRSLQFFSIIFLIFLSFFVGRQSAISDVEKVLLEQEVVSIDPISIEDIRLELHSMKFVSNE